LNQSKNESSPETHFFGLFDGHAGGKCSQHVASNLASVLLEDEDFSVNLPQAIKRSFFTCNEQFLKIAEKMKLHDGSTGLVSLIRDNKILVANAGDCRALLISSGRAIQLSTDHKPTSPDEQKRIAALGGTVVYCMGVARVNRVLAVSRAFGNRTLRTVIRPDAELMQRELVDGDDFLVMASDGLWDVLKNKDVCDVCYSPFLQRKPQQIADELVHLALARGSMDNVTCIVVSIKDLRNRSDVRSSEGSRQQEMYQNTNNNNSRYASSGHGNANNGIANNDQDDNETVDYSHANHQLPPPTTALGMRNSNNARNAGNGNNNLAHDGLSKQYSSLNNLRASTTAAAGASGEENNSTGYYSNANDITDSIALMKKSMNTPSSRQLMKAGSTNSIPLIDAMNYNNSNNSFMASNNYQSQENNNNTGKLFTPVTQNYQQQLLPPTSAAQRFRNNNNVSNSSNNNNNNLANSLRNSVSTNRRMNNNQLDSGPTPISRASLNDISSMIHDFSTNSEF
jgi:serine/threonine protein phosphatase PrpC